METPTSRFGASKSTGQPPQTRPSTTEFEWPPISCGFTHMTSPPRRFPSTSASSISTALWPRARFAEAEDGRRRRSLEISCELLNSVVSVSCSPCRDIRRSLASWVQERRYSRAWRYTSPGARLPLDPRADPRGHGRERRRRNARHQSGDSGTGSSSVPLGFPGIQGLKGAPFKP